MPQTARGDRRTFRTACYRVSDLARQRGYANSRSGIMYTLVTTASTPEQSEDLARFAAALAGQYDVEREIGRGGMGIVYLARDLKLDRRVAIKTLPPHLASRSRRARAVSARSAHRRPRSRIQNIVPDPSRRRDRRPGVLRHGLRRRRVARAAHSRSRPPRSARSRARSCATSPARSATRTRTASSTATSRRRTFSSTRSTGRAMVTDFGIARLAEAAPLTATGQVLGTVYYLSPEQVSGDAVDARSDIYSLGVVGYFALVGPLPVRRRARVGGAHRARHARRAPPLHTVAPRRAARARRHHRSLSRQGSRRSLPELRRAWSTRSTASSVDVVDAQPQRADRHAAAATPSLISDTEAQSILGRAAELQATTGIEPRPAPVADAPRRRRATPRERRATSRPTSATPRSKRASRRKYVDHAFEEHGLAPLAPLEARAADRSSTGAQPANRARRRPRCTSSTRSSSTARCRRTTTICSPTSSVTRPVKPDSSRRSGARSPGRRTAEAQRFRSPCWRAAARRRFEFPKHCASVAGGAVRRHHGRLRRRNVGHLDRRRRRACTVLVLGVWHVGRQRSRASYLTARGILRT